MNNSLLLSAKNKYFGWQLNLGQNYRKRRVVFSSKQENGMNSLLSKRMRIVQGNNFIKSALTFDMERSFVA
jgi:hypothetical protein